VKGHLQVAHLLVEVVPRHLQVALLLSLLQVSLLLLELMCQHQFPSLSVLAGKTVRLQLNYHLLIHPIIYRPGAVALSIDGKERQNIVRLVS
jgi:hypothetical protein